MNSSTLNKAVLQISALLNGGFCDKSPIKLFCIRVIITSFYQQAIISESYSPIKLHSNPKALLKKTCI
jgi:hypothetical protein